MKRLLILLIALGLATSLHAAPPSTSQITPVYSETLAPGLEAHFLVYPDPGASATPESAIKAAADDARKLFETLDSKTSSDIAEINKNAGKKPVKTNPTLFVLLKACNHISDWTEGLFDVARGKSPEKNGKLEITEDTGEVRLSEKDNRLDISSVRSGFLIDRMTGVLKSKGYENFTIQVGEIMRAVGRNGDNYWRFNVSDPNGSGKELCRLSLEASSVATADVRDLRGTVERLGVTLTAPSDLRSVTVITQNATSASALASTALVAGRDRAEKFFGPLLQQGFGVILEDRNGKIKTLGDVTAACFEE